MSGVGQPWMRIAMALALLAGLVPGAPAAPIAPIAPAAVAAPMIFGINAPRDGRDAVKWEALGRYFAAALGAPVSTAGYPPNRIGRELGAGSVAFALVNPVTAVEALARKDVKAIATLRANGGTQFAGVIITRRDSGIVALADLRGRNVLAFQSGSAGGNVFQQYHLLQNGIDPRRDLKSLRHNNKQDEIVATVLERRIDAGFVRSGVLEALAAEGKLRLDDVRVIDERHDELRQRHSTALYPEWMLLTSSRLDQASAERLRRAALALGADHPAARAAGIDGFVEPASLETVREALRALGLPPFGPALP